jgi:hypothetical protein
MRSKPRRSRLPLAIVAAAAGSCVLWSLASSSGSEMPESSAAGTTAAAAMTAFKDPQSGRFVAPREGAFTGPGQLLLRGLDRSQAGLVEQPGETAAGGVRLDLQGRFGSALVARRDAAGHLTLECATAPPTTAAAEAGAPAAGAAERRAEPHARDPE